MPNGLMEHAGDLSGLGVAKETSFGTPTSPVWLEPFKTLTMAADIGSFYPQLVTGTRDVNVYPLRGQETFTGDVGGSFFPISSIPLLVAAIGNDGGRSAVSGVAAGNGITGSTPSIVKTGTVAAIVAGATTASYTVTGTTPAPVVGDIIQIDTNTVTTTAEVRKVSTVTGSGPYVLTMDSAFCWAHAASAPAKAVIAPFVHTIVPANNLDSLTLEQVVGGYQSQQFFGSRVSKATFSVGATNTEAQATFTCDAMGVNILSTPSAIPIDSSSPFVFEEGALTLFGQNYQLATSVEIDLDNGLKPNYTIAGQYGPTLLTATSRKVTGKVTLVFLSLNDSTYGFFSRYTSFQGGALSLSLTHPNNQSITLNLSNITLNKYTDDLKLGDIVMSNLTFTANLVIGSGNPIMTANISNGVYIPY